MLYNCLLYRSSDSTEDQYIFQYFTWMSYMYTYVCCSKIKLYLNCSVCIKPTLPLDIKKVYFIRKVPTYSQCSQFWRVSNINVTYKWRGKQIVDCSGNGCLFMFIENDFLSGFIHNRIIFSITITTYCLKCCFIYSMFIFVGLCILVN